MHVCMYVCMYTCSQNSFTHVYMHLCTHFRAPKSDNLVATLSESYSRAYVSLIKIQQCSELEEIIEYKLMQRRCICIFACMYVCIHCACI